MIRRWGRAALADDVLRRLFRNVAYLFSANMVVALIGFLTLTVMARALGPAGLGVIALIEAYTRSVDRLLRFEPWQAVVRYGASALENDRRQALGRLIKCATLFDMFGAGLAAVVAVCGAELATSWFEFDADQTEMAIWFSAALLFNISSTPTAILRLFNRFDLLAKLSVGFAVFRLLLAVGAWQLGGDLWYFIVILMVSQVMQQLTLFCFAWRELGRQGFKDVWKQPRQGLLAENLGLPEFVWNSNINVIARSTTQRFDTLILGAILDPAAAGLYQLAKRTALAVLRLGRPIQQAVYPDVARLWARGEVSRFRRVVLRVNGVMGAIGAAGFVVAALGMDFFIHVAFGEAFAAAAPLVTVQVLAVALFLAGNTLNPALLSMGADRHLLVVTLTATFAFFAAFVPLVHLFGPAGANMCHVLFSLFWLLGCLMIFLRRTRPAADPASSLPGGEGR